MSKKDDIPAALDHVLYEIQMLLHALLAIGLRREKAILDGSGWLEVFAIHARNLNEFFGKQTGYPSDMKPNHFVAWDYSCYAFDNDLQTRANKQVAHLTYERETPEEKTGWAVCKIFESLQAPSLVFLKAVRAVDEMMNYKDNRSRTEELLVFLPRIRITDDKIIVMS
jgi:hypothetical protein